MLAYANWLIRHRWWVIALTLVLTGVLGAFAAGLKVVIDPAALAPQGHPYIAATNHVEKVFGSKYLMLIGVTPKQGDALQPAVLERIERITHKLENTPGVVKATLASLAAPQSRAIRGTADGFEAKPLLERLPVTEADRAALKAAIEANPVYLDTVVSRDFRTAAILVELEERSDGFGKMVEPVLAAVDAERSPDIDITLGGNPVYLDKTEKFSERIGILFPIAIVVIGLLHYEAFRTRQGLILPLVTALMAVAWGTGFMGLLGQQMDIFNSPTPILILAIAAGHAVQLLKRYYEEYELLRADGKLDPLAANREAVVRSLAGVGPVMMIAGGVAALGFFSLLVFNIATIRAFGIFTGAGILSAVLLEMTFIPAVRSLLKPPSDRDRHTEKRDRIWDRIPRWIGEQVIPVGRRRVVAGAALLLVGLCVLGMQRIVIDNASKNFFASNLDIQRDDEQLNRALGGTNSLYIMVEGKQADAIKDPAVLRAIESTQRFAESQADVGKTISIVDYLERMNQAMNGDAPAAHRLPDSRELIAQYLLLYSMSGNPGDFDAWVDYDYKAAKITLLLKTGSNARIRALVDALQAHVDQTFGPDVTVTFGGDVAQTIALTDTMVHGKLANIAQIAGAIFIISALAFRSPLAGLIVLVPLAMAVAAVFGVMGLAGIPLNIPNSLISAMAVGIGADYAIYLLYRMRERVRAGAGMEDAVRQTLASAGKAALFVATAVAGGYGVLALSLGYNVHLWLSLFIVLAMTVSVFASLFLVPALVLWLRPGFILGGGVAQPALRTAALLLAGALGLTLAVAPRKAPAAETAATLMQKNYAASRVHDSLARATFTLVNRDGAQRVRETTGATRMRANGDDNLRYVRFTAPADIKGTATLLAENGAGEDDLWIYLPALGKTRRLSASNKKDAFVGTDFSYGDILGHKPGDWTHAVLRAETVDGVACTVVESLPASPAARDNSGYARRLTWVRDDNFMTQRAEFFDLAGQPLKRMTAGEIRAVGNGHWQAMVSTVENLQTGHRTTIRFDDFKADQGVDEKLFDVKALERS
ncbi:outer membrane lipoprotein-sorting protein [Derxia lacustris]|uniref:outer membrane lipoprotein-sorting protein n=1 Tax=Derxia lacustris TaxID=764842 RepID=UPI001C385F6D|nr:outer membrane lipoprotein-sorting protein [Derxia lacustris]